MSLNFLCTAATSSEGSTYNCVRCGPFVSPSSPPHPAPPSPHGKLFATVNCPGVAQATADSMPSMFEPVNVSNMKGWSYNDKEIDSKKYGSSPVKTRTNPSSPQYCPHEFRTIQYSSPSSSTPQPTIETIWSTSISFRPPVLITPPL